MFYALAAMLITTGVDFGEARGRRPLGSDTEGDEICLPPLGFLGSNAHLALEVNT